MQADAKFMTSVGRSTTVVGSSIAALATAERLSNAGKRVNLVCTGAVGGAFAAMTIKGRSVNAGVRLIEREYVDGENATTPPPLHHYVPGHSGHRPWMPLVDDYIHDLVPDLEAAPAPRLLLEDRWAEDFTLTSRVSAISDLFTEDELAIIATQAAAAWKHFGYDEGIYAFPEQYTAATVAEASKANHGQFFHDRLVEPLARTLIPLGASVVAADQRQKVWAPLYWPSTLHEAATHQPTKFTPNRIFWTDKSGGMGEIVNSLMARLTNSPLLEISHRGRLTSISETTQGIEMGFADSSTLTADTPVLGVSPGDLFAAANIKYKPRRVQMTLAWAEVPEAKVSDPSPATLLKSGQDAFRITAVAPHLDDNSVGQRVFCIEFRHDTNVVNQNVVAQALLDARMVDNPDSVSLVDSRSFDAFVVPSHESRQEYEDAHAQLSSKFSRLTLVGGAAGYASDPLNEQLFSGIRTAMETGDAHTS